MPLLIRDVCEDRLLPMRAQDDQSKGAGMTLFSVRAELVEAPFFLGQGKEEQQFDRLSANGRVLVAGVLPPGAAGSHPSLSPGEASNSAHKKVAAVSDRYSF
jgi:hypothetical protein